MNIVCSGPGPHIPAGGVLGQSSVPNDGMRCPAAPCLIVDSPSITMAAANAVTLRAQAQNALANNTAYLGLVTPTTLQVVTQVQALTRQTDAMIRLLIGQLDATT